MISWLRLIPVGLLGATLASACVIVQTEDEGDDDAETGGTSGKGGSSGSKGGASGSGGQPGGGGKGGQGGSSGGTGGTANGGTANGGTANGGMAGDGSGEADICDDPEEGPQSTRLETCEFDNPGPCEMCLMEFCCLEVRDCYGTEPNNVCGYGNGGMGEFTCVVDCLAMYSAEGDIPDQMAISDCIGSCQDAACTVAGEHTWALVACMTNDCDVCYLPEEP
ncbi:MAG: hypothetical protein DIU78_013200 [Pseudomonadota bacterium]|nr:MAG: hypothetical protein DIU78_07495 [Pseudomonadota bacterium]